jgi:hypothetical protein
MWIDVAGILIAAGVAWIFGALFYGMLRLLSFLPAMGKHWHRCMEYQYPQGFCETRWRHSKPWCAVGLDYPCPTCAAKKREKP